MPKLKTNRAAAKRFKRTATGKFKRAKAFARHLATGKSAKRRRGLRGTEVLDGAEAAKVARMIPYK